MTSPNLSRAPFDWSKVFPSAADSTFARFASRRSVVYGTKGVVACSQPLAAQAGLEVLGKGGNAADAAVAVAAALNVTEPSCTGIGGDMFCLFYDASTRRVRALNGSGRAPRTLSLAKARDLGINGREIPLTNINSVTVPGAAAGWCDTVEWLGSGKVGMQEVLAPAIRLAEEGYPCHEVNSFAWQRSENLIREASPDGTAMLPVNGRAPRPGELVRLPDLAKTFRELVAKGKKGFYEGRVAEAIVELIKSKGGVMELSDLAEHTTEEVEPISYIYGHVPDKEPGVTVYECPPNGQGLTALVALGILDELQNEGRIPDLSTIDHNSTAYLHALIETLRLAFADTRYYVADPNVVHVPVKELLSKEYLKKRAALFDPKKATADVKKGSPVNTSNTVYFSVTDKYGNACSFINSNYAGFGTAAIPRSCGFTLQNRGSCFTLEEGHPNCLEGGKRPYHTIIPAMVTKGDELYLSYGVMGGFMQPQGHVQVLINLLHKGCTVQEALDAPRFCISAGLPDANDKSTSTAGDINSELMLEEGIAPDVVEELAKMGHQVKLVKGHGRGVFGRGQMIMNIADKATGKRVWAAGSDQRIDGHAVAEI